METIFTDMRTGKAARKVTFRNGWTVETWWDRRSRTYITSVKDGDGYQQGDACVDGESTSAAVSFDWALAEAREMIAALHG